MAGSKPSIKLVELRRESGVYKVVGLVDTAKFSIDQRLKKEEVTALVEAQLYKITISGEK